MPSEARRRYVSPRSTVSTLADDAVAAVTVALAFPLLQAFVESYLFLFGLPSVYYSCAALASFHFSSFLSASPSSPYQVLLSLLATCRCLIGRSFQALKCHCVYSLGYRRSSL
jgi:hypothetical protein